MSDLGGGQPHPARSEEADALRRLVTGAYALYVERMGKPPGPMLVDYSRRVEDRKVWVVSTLPAEILSRRFRNAHHYRFCRQQLAAA
jgi:hypothetical protein